MSHIYQIKVNNESVTIADNKYCKEWKGENGRIIISCRWWQVSILHKIPLRYVHNYYAPSVCFVLHHSLAHFHVPLTIFRTIVTGSRNRDRAQGEKSTPSTQWKTFLSATNIISLYLFLPVSSVSPCLSLSLSVSLGLSLSFSVCLCLYHTIHTFLERT